MQIMIIDLALLIWINELIWMELATTILEVELEWLEDEFAIQRTSILILVHKIYYVSWNIRYYSVVSVRFYLFF